MIKLKQFGLSVGAIMLGLLAMEVGVTSRPLRQLLGAR